MIYKGAVSNGCTDNIWNIDVLCICMFRVCVFERVHASVLTRKGAPSYCQGTRCLRHRL